MQNKSAVIIGSGVAGIATAIRLAVQGYNVKVFEKNDKPGGKLTAFESNGFSFDAGPSLFTQPQNIEELFQFANEPIADYFTYQKIDVACKYFFENGKQVTAYTDANLFANELENTVGENSEVVKTYLSNAEKLYVNIGNIFLNFSLHKQKTWLHKRVLNAIRFVKIPYLTKSLNSYNQVFKAKETQQIFNRYATYNGSNPYKAPAMLSLIPHLEINEGTFFPKGGMISITNALYKLALKKGVQFFFNQQVDSIICPQNKAIGIVVNNKNIFADIVVCNSDVYFMYSKLLHNNKKAGKVLKQERSSSAFVFYWGINKTFDTLGLHNIFFTKNYQQEFNAIFKNSINNDPTVYINITSKCDTSLAPNDCENWFVMVNTTANTNYNIEEVKQNVKQNIIKKLNNILQVDLEKHIVFEDILHPQTIETNTSSYLGSLYGTSSNSKLAAFLRQPNFVKTVKNLYCCGGSVHPGGGIPLCLSSAKIVSDLVQQNNKKNTKAHV